MSAPHTNGKSRNCSAAAFPLGVGLKIIQC